MPRKDLGDLRVDFLNRLILDLYAEAHNFDIEGFDSFAVKTLNHFFRFDSAVVATLDIPSSTEYSVNSLFLHNQPLEKYTDRNYWESDAPDPMLMRAVKQPNRSVTAELQHMPEMSQAMLAYADKYEIKHSLTYCSRAPKNNAFGAIALWRARGEVFSEEEGRLADLLLPHLFQAQQLNRQHHALKLKLANLTAVSLICDLSGRIAFIDDSSVEVIRSEWPNWRPPLLPQQLLESLAQDQAMVFKGKALKIAGALHGAFLCLKVQKLSESDILTARELSCLSLVRAGQTSGQIAAQLGITERTANFHITNAMQKLDAPTRRQAAEKAAKIGLI